jgi:hypothetical protein
MPQGAIISGEVKSGSSFIIEVYPSGLFAFWHLAVFLPVPVETAGKKIRQRTSYHSVITRIGRINKINFILYFSFMDHNLPITYLLNRRVVLAKI